jgi:nitroimidazol reductase NimA-like FMN-containing flavoprotein (pyridoxamine 5'-phosphate oxidase superfamily)
MRIQDEPVLGPDFNEPLWQLDAQASVIEQIRELVTEQPFAVLCTQGEGQPYGSIVAFAFSQDLTAGVFATSVATRKFRLLSECERVALVIDDRAKHPDDMMKVGAITVTGRATQLEPGPDLDCLAELLTDRHPYLKPFVSSPSTALFRVDVVRYLYVTRFQEVRQWIPASAVG